MWRLDGLEDGPAEWVPLGAVRARVVALAAPAETQVVYAADESGQVVRSTDRGSTWGSSGEIRFRRVWRIIVDPADADRVYVASGSAAEADPQEGEIGLWESADGGRTWTEVLTGDTIDAAVDPHDGSILYAAVRDEGLCISVKAGRDWRLAMPFVSRDVHAGSMIRVALGRATEGPKRTVAVRFGQEVYVNRHGGRPRRLPGPERELDPDGGPWISIGRRGGDGPEGRQVLAIDPFDDDVLVTGGENLVRTEAASAPAGGEWSKVAGVPRRKTGTQELVFDPLRRGVVYRAHANGIERSTDGGRTWAPIGAPG
jgi:hypothetical protein